MGAKGWVDARAGCEMKEMDGEWGENFIAIAMWQEGSGDTIWKVVGGLRKMAEKWMEAHCRYSETYKQPVLTAVAVSVQVRHCWWHSCQWQPPILLPTASRQNTLGKTKPRDHSSQQKLDWLHFFLSPRECKFIAFGAKVSAWNTWLCPNDTRLPCKEDG